MKRLAGSCWGAAATTLRIATLAQVHSTTEYCALVWRRSAPTRLNDLAINDALRVTACLRPASTHHLPILAGTQPSENARHLKSINSFAPGAQHLINSTNNNNRSASALGAPPIEFRVIRQHTRLCTFIPDTGTHPPGMAVPRDGSSGGLGRSPPKKTCESNLIHHDLYNWEKNIGHFIVYCFVTTVL